MLRLRRFILVIFLLALFLNRAVALDYRYTVAVMPFENLNKDSSLDWLSGGIPDSLICKLQNVKELRLVERAYLNKILEEQKLGISGFVDPKTAAKTGKILGADTVVVGSFQRSGAQIRIGGRFVKTETSEVIRAEQVTGKTDDIFGLEDQLALKITESLNVKVTTEEKARIETKPTKSIDAYECYIKGRNEYIKLNVEGYKKALEWYKKALDIDLAYALAYSGIGQTNATWGFDREQNGLSAKGYFEASIKASKRAIELNPDIGEAHKALACSYKALKGFDEAREEARKALKLTPNDAEVYIALALLEDDYSKAIEYEKKAVELNPLSSAAHNNLGLIYLTHNELNKAGDAFKKAIGVDPECAFAHYNLGLVEHYTNNINGAIKEYKKTIELNPELILAYNNLGLLYIQMGNVQEGVAKFKEGLKVCPESPEIHTNLCVLLRSQGNFVEAEKECKKALKAKPDLKDAHLNLGVIYQMTGQIDLAILEYEKYLQIDSTSQAAQIVRQELQKLKGSYVQPSPEGSYPQEYYPEEGYDYD